MPRLSKLLIRAALIHMGIGFFIGSLLLWNKGLPFAPAIWRLRASHIELLIFGWTMQIAMGVSFWVIPRFSTGNRYGKEIFGWISFVLLNVGVITTAVALWWGKVPVLAFGGRILVFCAILSYVRLMWPRVKPFAIG